MSAQMDLASLVLAPAPDLHFSRQGRGERVRYVASDVRRGRHAALNPDAYRLLGAFDGRRSLREIYAAGADQLPPPDTTAKLVLQLHSAGLVTIVSGTLPPTATAAKGPPEAKLVSWRRELVDVGPWLPRLDRWLGWMFSRTGVLLWCVVALVALWTLADHWTPNFDALGWLSQLDAGEALTLYLIFLLLKGFHELGHALAYWRLAAAEGVHVRSVRAGIALMFLLPFPFTNVSGAWRLSSRFRRGAVGAAGMYVESWVALLAVLVWAWSGDPVLRSVAGQVAVVAGATTLLFNLNPLGRMDGYYIFADLIDRPNLGRQASQTALTVAARLTGAMPADRSGSVEPMLLAYWVGSLLFRVSIYVALFWTALRSGAALAVVVLLIAGSLLLFRPMASSLRWLRSVSSDTARLQRRLILLGVAVAVLLLLPLPSTIHLDGVVERQGLSLVYPSRAAPLAAQGRLAFSETEAQLELAELEAKHQQTIRQWRHALEEGQPDARSYGEEAQVLAKQAADLRQDVADLRGQLAGRDVTPLDIEYWRGSWVPVTGRPIAVKMPTDRYVIRAVGQERDRDLLSRTREGRARPLGHPEAAFGVKLTTIEPGTAENLPSAALGRRGGGHIAIDPADQAGRRAAEPVVATMLQPEVGAPALRHGQRVEIRMRGPLRPLILQWVNRLMAVLGAPSVA